MSSRWPLAVVLALWGTAVSCGTDQRSAGSSPVDTGEQTAPPSTETGQDPEPNTTSSQSTTSPPSTVTSTIGPSTTSEPGADQPTPLVADDVTCDLEWSTLSSPSGEVTFARGDAIFSYEPATDTLHCLAQVDREPHRLDWNPAGDMLLVDEDLIVTADGQHASGFPPGTTGISWSQPTGKALIAPSADGTRLDHIDASNPADITDVSALAVTWAAAYHPSGLAIVSAGVSDDGAVGLFIADNVGNGLRQLMFLEDAETRITEVGFAPDGSSVSFVHDHTGGAVDDGIAGEIHRLGLFDLVVFDVASLPDVVPTGLLVSEEVDGAVAWTQRHAPTNTTTITWNGGDQTRIGFPDTMTAPVGFFDEGAAVGVVQPSAAESGGAAGGAADSGDVWVFPPEGSPQLVAKGVSAATTRTLHHPTWSDPPLQIDQQAVG